MEEIMVSIICNTYNHEQYIADALNSFVNQKTTFKFEVLVHDDASTDNTPRIIKEFENKYPDIIKPIYQKENQHSKNRKITWDIQLPRAKGKYIAFCEGDDYWTDMNKLQMCIDFMQSHSDYFGVFHCVEMYDCNREAFAGDISLKMNDNAVFCDFCFSDAIRNACHTSSFFVKKDVLTKEKPDYFMAIKNVGDYPLKIFLTQQGKIGYINKKMSVYRCYSNSTSYTSMLETGKDKKTLRINYHLNCLALMFSVKRNATKEEKEQINNKIKEDYYSLFYMTRSFFAVRRFSYFIYSIEVSIKAILRKIKNNICSKEES